MTNVFVAILLFTQSGFAHEMPEDEKVSVFAKEVKSFEKDCLKKHKIKEVKDIFVVNKTSESLDKKIIASEMMKNLKLKINPKSNYKIDAKISSSSTEKDKVKSSIYDIEMALMDTVGKETCKMTYSREIVETR
jgi:hypothetical protein